MRIRDVPLRMAPRHWQRWQKRTLHPYGKRNHAGSWKWRHGIRAKRVVWCRKHGFPEPVRRYG